MSNITAVLISHDSGPTIIDLLTHLAGHIGHVVIVDNGSTDETISMLRSASPVDDMRIRLFEKSEWWPYSYEPLGPLAVARNFAIGISSSEWILSLDDDEWVDPGGLQRLVHLAGCETRDAGFLSWNTYDGKGKLIVSDYKLSFFRSGKGIHYEGLFHENATVSARRVSARCFRPDVEIVHRPCSRRFPSKPQRYLREVTAAIELQPTCARLRWFCGLTHYRMGNVAAAKLHLTIASAIEDPRHPIERINSYALLGSSDMFTASFNQRIEWLNFALELCKAHGNDPEMVAYDHIVQAIRDVRERLGQMQTGDFFPAHLFYCFYILCHR